MDQDQNKTSGYAIASLVLGISSFFLGFLIPSILAIVFANLSKNDTGGELCTYAKVGKICGIISLVLTSIAIVFAIIYVAVVVQYISPSLYL